MIDIHSHLLPGVVGEAHARDLLLTVEVRMVPTPRDPDGIPVGSATRALDAEHRDGFRARRRGYKARLNGVVRGTG